MNCLTLATNPPLYRREPDVQMALFYVAIEGRPSGGKLRKMYIRHAGDTSRGGHLVSTLRPERLYNEKDARTLMKSAAREWPEWGVTLQPA